MSRHLLDDLLQIIALLNNFALFEAIAKLSPLIQLLITIHILQIFKILIIYLM